MNSMEVCGIRYFKPVCHTAYGLLMYRKEKLYILEDGDKSDPSFVCDLPIEDPRGKFCICPLAERLMHIDLYCGIAVSNGAVVAFNKGIYFVDLNSRQVRREHDFTSGMRRPFNFYEIRNVKGFSDGIVYGEYTHNADQAPVSMYRRTDSGAWEIVYTFPAHTIRHIHSIIPDPYRSRVIICTGDNGEEAAIWAAYDDFSRVEKIWGGNQDYRACCARAYPQGILLLTDSPHFQKYDYLLTEAQGQAQRQDLCKIPGPTVFFTEYEDQVVFATDVEYDERRLNRITKYATYRRGPGVQDWYSHIFMGSPNKGFREVAKLKKDCFPMGAAMGFGGVAFPNGQQKGRVYFYPYAVELDKFLCYLTIDP